MDGPTAAQNMRMNGYRGLIFGITGNSLPSDIEQFISQGANRVFIKPLDLHALESALKGNILQRFL